MTAGSRAVLCGVALLVLSCERVDIVAGGATPDAGKDAGGLLDGGVPDASDPPPDTGPVDPPDSGPDNPQGDGGTDAGTVVPPDAGPMLPRVCPAQTCGAALAQRDSFCAAARPAAVVLGDSCDATARPRFAYAICSCTDLVTNSPFDIEALDGSASSASIAVNEQLTFGMAATIAGSIHVSGNFRAAVAPTLSGALYQDMNPNCVCDPGNLLNIAGLIQARASDNDNAAAQLTASSLNDFTSQTLALDCGRYYFDRVSANGDLQIEARGRIALFIAGDLGISGALTLALQAGASAEIFVLGNMSVGGPLELSTTSDGNRVLLAVNGTGTLNLAGAVIDGSIYAPRAEIVTRGPFELNGALFVNRANFGDRARVRYQAIPNARASCSP